MPLLHVALKGIRKYMLWFFNGAVLENEMSGKVYWLKKKP